MIPTNPEFDGDVIQEMLTTTDVKITDANRQYVIGLLQPGDLVSYKVNPDYDPNAKLFSDLVLEEIVWGLDLEPLLRTTCREAGSFHSSHLVEVKLIGPRNKLKSYTYQPMGFLCSYYSDSSEVVWVLEAKYGHLPSWKRTLYDIGAISQYLHDNRIKGKKRKEVILRLAPRSKLKIASVVKEHDREMLDFYNTDMELDYYDEVY